MQMMQEALLPEPDWIPERPSDEAIIVAKDQLVEVNRLRVMSFLRTEHLRVLMSHVTGRDLNIDLTANVLQPEMAVRSKVSFRRGKPPENNEDYASDVGALLVLTPRRSDLFIRCADEIDRPVIADELVREYMLGVRNWLHRNINCLDEYCDIEDVMRLNVARGRRTHEDILNGTFGWQYMELEEPQEEEPQEETY